MSSSVRLGSSRASTVIYERHANRITTTVAHGISLVGISAPPQLCLPLRLVLRRSNLFAFIWPYGLDMDITLTPIPCFASPVLVSSSPAFSSFYNKIVESAGTSTFAKEEIKCAGEKYVAKENCVLLSFSCHPLCAINDKSCRVVGSIHTQNSHTHTQCMGSITQSAK